MDTNLDMGGSFFNPGPFMPHGGCYLWTQSLMALHAVSDGAIALAYYAIPLILLHYVRQRKDLKFKWIFVCFAAFVLACGTTHLMEIWNIWHADYWLSGCLKAVTAAVSVFTTLLLVKLLPAARALPSAADLLHAHAELENRVRERTAELRRTERALRTTSGCNQSLVRAGSETALLEEICRVIVEAGGYRMTWVGYAENDAEKSVRVAARAGRDEGYLEQAKISWDESSAQGRGPIGTAIRTGQIAVSHDFQGDPTTAPWRAAALQRGYASSMVLPLRDGEQSIGVLVIYAAEANAFNPAEIELLRELAADLAYGIQSLRTRLEHRQAEVELQRREQNYREIFNATSEAIFLHDAATGEVVEVNDAMLRLYGYADKTEVLGLRVGALSAQELRYTQTEALAYIRRANTEGPQVFEWRGRKKNGDCFWAEVSLRSSQIGGAGRTLAVVRDITERKQAEEKLRLALAEAERFRAAMDQVNACVYLKDLQSRYLYANQPTQKLFGLSADTLVGCSDTRFFPRDTVARMREIDARVFRGEPTSEEVEVRDAHGRRRVYWEVKTPIYADPERKQVCGLLGIATDITERKQAEEAVRDSERRYRSLFELESDAIILVDCETHRYVDANLSALRLYGYSREELLQMTPEQISEEPEKTRAVIGTGQFFIPLRWHRKKNGERFAAEIAASQIDYQGRQTELATIRDITERKQAEQALANERALLRTLVDNLPVAVYLKDPAGRKTLTNPVDLRNMGLMADAEVLGKTDYDLFPPEQAAVFHADDQQVLLTGRPVINHEEKITRPDGSIQWLLTSKVPVFDHAGQVTGLAGIGLDITERRLLENRMQQAQKMEAIGTLAGGIAHDFNNMLAAMFGFCYLLEQDTQGNRAAQESIAEIFKAANRAKELVQQILTFGRRREQKREVIRLEPILKEATKFLRASLPAQIQIEKSFAADTPAVLADPTQVHQVAMNLATNALHAMEDRPGTLTVTLESFQPEADFLHRHPECRPVPYARLTVADTGQGMDAQTLERIFEPFFTTKPTGKGTGLGLAVVHGIVQAHEGFITVESQPGRGTTFGVYFPAQTTDAADVETTADQVPRGQGQSLLLVDDEPALTMSLQQLLGRLNYQITTSNSPREALGLFQQAPARFALVITDLAMPEMNGLALARQLHELCPNLPVVLTSGFTSDLTPENLQAAGIFGVIEKPVSMRVLAEVLQRALAGPSRPAAAANDERAG